MRLAAAEKLGHYPIPPEATTELIKHFALGPVTEKASDFTLLDPCAGQGEAIKQVADALHVPYQGVYCVELDKGRGEVIRQALPRANVLAPCSLFSTFVSHRSFSLIYANPPFDDGLGAGSGRDELTFVKEAYSLLADQGVAVIVIPLKTFKNHEMYLFLDCHFKDMTVYRFPEPVYGEVVVFGRKRSNPLEPGESKGYLQSAYALERYGNRSYDYQRRRYKGLNDIRDLPALGTVASDWEDGVPSLTPHTSIRVYQIPPSWRPSRFVKSGYLLEELIEALNESPNDDIYREQAEPPLQESVLPLIAGHVALLVTSGSLDGLIEVPDDTSKTHIMRGISRKREYLNEELCKAVLNEKGTEMKVTEVYSEQMETKIRAIDRSFQVFSFGLEPRKVDGKQNEHTVAIETTEGEPGSVTIVMERKGNSDYVTLTLNDRRGIKFCFDTGAEICQLSSQAIEGLDYFLTGRPLSLIGAHGVVVQAKEVIIPSMTLSGLTAKNVRCAIVESENGEASALLGQNFLRLFDYHYSQHAHTLTLTLAKKEAEEEVE